MHLGFGRFGTGLSVVFLCAASLCLWASALVQQGGESAGDVQSGTRTAATSRSDFEVKVIQGEFLVRQKGTSEWKRSSKLNEPIAVGFVDGDHKIYVATKAIKPPKSIRTEPPDYPANETNSGKKRWVWLHIVVDDHGAVRFPTVDASPGPEFTKAAIEAVQRWTFEPAKLNGQSVAVLVNVTMAFY